MQKLLVPKFKEGQFVVTKFGTGEVYRVDPIGSSNGMDGSVYDIVLVTLDGHPDDAPTPLWADSILSCD